MKSSVHVFFFSASPLQVTRTCVGWSCVSRSSGITTGWSMLSLRGPKMCWGFWGPARFRTRKRCLRLDRTHTHTHTHILQSFLSHTSKRTLSNMRETGETSAVSVTSYHPDTNMCWSSSDRSLLFFFGLTFILWQATFNSFNLLLTPLTFCCFSTI